MRKWDRVKGRRLGDKAGGGGSQTRKFFFLCAGRRDPQGSTPVVETLPKPTMSVSQLSLMVWPGDPERRCAKAASQGGSLKHVFSTPPCGTRTASTASAHSPGPSVWPLPIGFLSAVKTTVLERLEEA